MLKTTSFWIMHFLCFSAKRSEKLLTMWKFRRSTLGPQPSSKVDSLCPSHCGVAESEVLFRNLWWPAWNDILVVKLKNVEEIYWTEIPSYQRGIQLRIEGDKLDLPIFHKPERSTKEYRTSDNKSPRSRIWTRDIKKLREKAGLKQDLTQKVFHRGTINTTNSISSFRASRWSPVLSDGQIHCQSSDKAPSSARDQIADHESNAVKYYINKIAELDTTAASLLCPFSEAVQREARLVTLMAAMAAPTGITDGQSCWIRNRRRVRRLREPSRRMTAEIRRRDNFSPKDAMSPAIHEKKPEADRTLSRERTRLRENFKKKNRQRDFRDIDTAIFNQQLEHGCPRGFREQATKLTPPVSHIPGQGELVRRICRSNVTWTAEEEHRRRMACIRLWIRWQGR